MIPLPAARPGEACACAQETYVGIRIAGVCLRVETMKYAPVEDGI